MVFIAAGVLLFHDSKAQSDRYDPATLFKGVQFTFDFDWTMFPAMNYNHLTGFEHEVRTKATFGYQLGFQGQYYFNEHVSVGIGVMTGSSRRLKKDVNITNPHAFDSYGFESDLQEWLMRVHSEKLYRRDRMTFNVSVPLYLSYHRYIEKNQRHRLDLRIGVAMRYHPDLEFHYGGGGVVYKDTVYYGFVDFDGFWQVPRKILFDLQPYLGYTFVLKNQRAINAGLYANIAFAKGRTPNQLSILERTDYEEYGTFTIHNHYVALRFGYVFTTPGRERAKRKQKGR